MHRDADLSKAERKKFITFLTQSLQVPLTRDIHKQRREVGGIVAGAKKNVCSKADFQSV